MRFGKNFNENKDFEDFEEIINKKSPNNKIFRDFRSEKLTVEEVRIKMERGIGKNGKKK